MGEKREYRRRRRPPEDMELQQRQVRRRQTQEPHRQPRRHRSVQEEQPYIDPRRVAQGRRMYRRKAERKKRRRRNILVVILLLLLLVAAYAGAKIWVAVQQWENKAEKSDFTTSDTTDPEEDEIINVAVFGTDEDGVRADVNMVASFNTGTKELHFISVPRDSKVIMTKEMTDYLESKNAYVPEQNGVYGQCKLTELHAYAGENNRCAFSVAMLEEILGMKMDYYVKVDLSAFRQIVDAVSGVDFNVEERLYYVDPYQDLYIDLYPGMQHLDGDKAEQLVRFRDGYVQKDLKRIEVQQQFIQALIEKVCSSDTLMRNLNDLVKVALDCTESNISVSEALKYVKYVKALDPAKITSDTVPYLGNPGRYVELDEDGIKELVNERIYGIAPQSSTEEQEENQFNESNQEGNQLNEDV